MTIADLKKMNIPNSPGVYFFLGKHREILYIGRATTLKNRIKSYFDVSIGEKRSALIEKMVREARGVEWTVTDSVLEAMLLEVNLIRTHKPSCNTISKDDKSYNHLVITNEEFPRVLVVRAKDLPHLIETEKPKYLFGPFPNGALFREALKIIRKLFQFYDMRHPLAEARSGMARGVLNFNRQIGLYPGAQSKREYARTIRHIRYLFEGKKHVVIRELLREMTRCAKAEEFERAGILKKKIYALKHIQDVALLKDESRVYRDERRLRIEAYDIAHLSGTDMVGVMTVAESGNVVRSEYRKFRIRTVKSSNDTAALAEIVSRRLEHAEWPLPELIVVDGGAAQKNVVERTLKKKGLTIPVVGVVKDEKHRPVRIIGPKSTILGREEAILRLNAEAHRFAITYHRTKRQKRTLSGESGD